jgi:hypothetical protein
MHTIVPVLSQGRVIAKPERVESDRKSDQEILLEFAKHRGISGQTMQYGLKLI